MWRASHMAGTDEVSATPAEVQKDVDFCWGVKIPLRDGIHLNATVYRPKGGDPVPAIFTLTPYVADSFHDRACYFARRGYAFALVDCRGRGNSEGEFEPLVHDGRDGYDVVEWLAAQSWCNTAVAMWGGSYGGFVQWMTLSESPPHLRTIVPAAAAHAGVDLPFFKNIFYPFIMQWLTFVSGVTRNAGLHADEAFWIEKFRELYLSHRPFRELDQIIGNPTRHFQTFLSHPTPDAYWDHLGPSAADYGRINIPILTITGHYDGDQPGALAYYQQHMGSASPARHHHYLIIGPWDHAGTRTPEREFGGLKLGGASLLDLNALHLAWYDWVLKDGPTPAFLKQRVTYYVAGAEEWRYADSLDAIRTATQRLYLSSAHGVANDAFHSGALEETPSAEAVPDRYIYDPLDVRPADLEREPIANYITDQRYALNLFGNGLVYHTPPFETEVEITGRFKLVLWIALDVPDTDLRATVYEILRDGSSILLTQDLLRARYRESPRHEKRVEMGEIERYEFDGFTFFARRIARGSRLRLVISSPNTIQIQKNYNSGGIVADESGEKARIAHVTLYHDADHPSHLEFAT